MAKTKTPTGQETPLPNSKINRTLLGTGLGLLLLTLTLGFYYKAPTDIQRYLILICASLGAGLIVSQINGIFNIKLPLGITATGSIGVMVMVFYLGKDLVKIQPGPKDDESFKSFDTDCVYPKAKFAIFCSANNDYNRNILISFINGLEERLPINNKKCVYYITKWGSGRPFDSASVRESYQSQIKELYFKEKFDYYVAIGTQAAIVLKDFLTNEKILTDKKFVFLGVTDPIASGIVEDVENRKENLNIGGVAYCGNYDEFPIKVSQLYPGKKLCFMYDKSYPQDEHLAKRLENSEINRSGRLQVISLDRFPNSNDFADTSRVYFSWMTFETMFGNEGIETLKGVKYLVSSTASQSEQGVVPFAVTTSDQEIGKKGAELISNVEKNNIKLGQADIIFPKWRVYVNVREARDRHISNQVVSLADFKYSDQDN